MVEALYEAYMIDGHLVHVGSSVGIAVGSAETACASDLLRRADVAMYEAKGSKTASFKIFDKRMSEMIKSEEHTSELQSLMRISYAVFCLKKKRRKRNVTYKKTYI